LDNVLAWSSILPGLKFSYLKQFRDGNNDLYGVSFGITVPLWFMLDQKGKIEETSALESASASEVQQMRNHLYLKVKNLFTEYKNSEKQVKLYKDEILPQSMEVYQTALKSYSAGEITYLEFLQAKQILISARSNYTNILLNFNLAIASLEEAIGENLK
jgi:outer membrane protein TolC